MRVMDTGSTKPTPSSSLIFLQNISAGCNYNWKYKNVKQTNAKRTNAQGSSVVCCYSAFVTSVHSIMTTGLPRMKLSRFSTVTTVYHTHWYLERNSHFDKLSPVPYKPQGSTDNHRYKWYGSLWHTATTMRAPACRKFWWPLAKVQGYASKITFIITFLSR
jgi:hypothetical protein